MGKTRDLSYLEKSMIIGYRAISKTTDFIECSRTAIVKIYRDWTKRIVTTTRRANCGAPHAIDIRGERRLRRFVTTNQHATVNELTMQKNRGVLRKISTMTVQRTLLRIGLRSRRLVKAPMLTKAACN